MFPFSFSSSGPLSIRYGESPAQLVPLPLADKHACLLVFKRINLDELTDFGPSSASQSGCPGGGVGCSLLMVFLSKFLQMRISLFPGTYIFGSPFNAEVLSSRGRVKKLLRFLGSDAGTFFPTRR